MRSVSRAFASLVVIFLALQSGCTFQDGQPWGRLALSVEGQFAPEEGRLDADGALKTSTSYLVEIDALRLSLDAVTLRQSLGGGSSAFDPADPPEGYSLCHNGHCHADDGSLVDYEDIALELAGGAEAGGPSLSILGAGATALSATPSALALADCPDGCALERGDLSSLEIVLGTLEVQGRVRDQLGGDAARLPEGGVRLDGVVSLGVSLAIPVDGSVGKGEPVEVPIGALLSLPGTLFDGLDWGQALAGALPTDDEAVDPGEVQAVVEALRANLEANSGLALTED